MPRSEGAWVLMGALLPKEKTPQSKLNTPGSIFFDPQLRWCQAESIADPAISFRLLQKA